MSSKHSKHHKETRSHWYSPQYPHESKGIAHNKKFNFYEVYHHFKTPNKQDISLICYTQEEADQKFKELNEKTK